MEAFLKTVKWVVIAVMIYYLAALIFFLVAGGAMLNFFEKRIDHGSLAIESTEHIS